MEWFDAEDATLTSSDSMFFDCEDNAWDGDGLKLSEELSAKDIIVEGPSKDPPLYEGAPLTLSEAAVALLTYTFHSESDGEDLSKVLALIRLFIPDNNCFFETLHSFFKFFENSKSKVHFIVYCTVCKCKLDSESSSCVRCKDGKVGRYIHMPVGDQVKRLYKRPKFLDLISHRFNRKKKNDNNFEDIYDGDIYKQALKSILKSPHDISFNWNADGLALFKSSNFQVWPFFLSINELPPHLRCNKEYMILAGIAFGSEKPDPNLFLEPLYNEMQKLQSGLDVTLYDGSSLNIKCCVLCGTCDAPAKSLFFHLKGHNGFYSCPKCLALGEKSDETCNVFVYPYRDELTLRTKESYEEHLKVLQSRVGKPKVPGETDYMGV